MTIRRAIPTDLAPLSKLRAALWPDAPAEEHLEYLQALFAGRPRSTLPIESFVAEIEGRIVGFAEVGLRSHADGCDPIRPCGYLEGWYVDPSFARRGIGRALIERAEDWARSLGCDEFASDTWLDNEESLAAHLALGFEVVDRCINLRKSIARDDDPKFTAQP